MGGRVVHERRIEEIVFVKPDRPVGGRLGDVLQIDNDTGRPPSAGSTRTAPVVTRDQRIVEIALPEVERPASPDCGGKTLELLERHVDAVPEQMFECTLEALLVDQSTEIPELASCVLQKLTVRASRVVKDRPFRHFEERRFPSSQLLCKPLPGGLDRDGLADESLQPQTESEQASKVGNERHGSPP